MQRPAQLSLQETCFFLGSPQNWPYFSLLWLTQSSQVTVFSRWFPDNCLMEVEVAEKYHRVTSGQYFCYFPCCCNQISGEKKLERGKLYFGLHFREYSLQQQRRHGGKPSLVCGSRRLLAQIRFKEKENANTELAFSFSPFAMFWIPAHSMWPLLLKLILLEMSSYTQSCLTNTLGVPQCNQVKMKLIIPG